MLVLLLTVLFVSCTAESWPESLDYLATELAPEDLTPSQAYNTWLTKQRLESQSGHPWSSSPDHLTRQISPEWMPPPKSRTPKLQGRLRETVKRDANSGWIWMPAQGYVPLPKSQETSDGDGGSGKTGKIMRYG